MCQEEGVGKTQRRNLRQSEEEESEKESSDSDSEEDGEEVIEQIDIPPAANKATKEKEKPRKGSRGKDMGKMKELQKKEKKADNEKVNQKEGVKAVRALDSRGKKVQLREIDPYKPLIAKNGTWVTEDDKVYGPFIEDFNESYMKEEPKDCYDWYEPGPRERLSQRRLPSADKIYAMEGVTHPWKQAYVAHHYNWMREGIEKRDKSLERHYQRRGRDSDSEEEFQVSYREDGPGRMNEKGRDRSPGAETVLSKILGRDAPRGSRERSE